MLKLITKSIQTFIFIIIISITSQINAQSLWMELNSMPIAIANNAVSQGVSNDTAYVYTFGGIDSTKLYSGITRASMRYNTMSEQWTMIPSLPDTLGKIASAANTINNIIYITGGYHVFPNSPFELSSDKIHRFDPEINDYLADGTPMPHAIDDHVQAVWNDSLLFIITGWSDTGNVPFVQVYNPGTDSWQEATSTPNNGNYKTFGASGVIIGNEIFYNGGAAGSSFNSTNRLRHGVINPIDPTDITWDLLEDNPGDKGYRMASVSIDNKVFWIGGSGVTYNFNGIAYNGSGGVPPLHRILSYDIIDQTWNEELNQPFGVMDLRGVAKISDSEFVICGGMTADQEVTNKAFLISIDSSVGIELTKNSDFSVYPNPVKRNQPINIRTINDHKIVGCKIYNNSSQLMLNSEINNCNGNNLEINQVGLKAGIYYLQLITQKGEVAWLDIVIE